MDGWMMLAAAVMVAPGTPWNPTLSDKLDRFVLQQRRAQERDTEAAMRTGLQVHARTIAGPYVPPRGNASAEEVQRRARMDAYLRAESAQGNWPKPRPLPTGKWQACVIHNGKHHRRVFTTEREASAFIREIKES